MRFVCYGLTPIDALWISLLILLVPIPPASATLQSNVTITHSHPSISYWPTTSWTTLATGTTGLQNAGCVLRQHTTFHTAPAGAEQRELEEPKPLRGAGSTKRSKELDDWQTRIRPSSHPRRAGSKCDASDIGTQGHPDVNHWPITFRFKFVGSAIYVFGFAVPLPLIDLSSTPGAILIIDGERVQTFPGYAGHSSSCSINEPIFSHTGLADGREHELLVAISPSWKFFLHSIILTGPIPDLASPSASLSTPTPTPPSTGSQEVLRPRAEEATSTTDRSKKHNIATFVAAVTAVVGVLTIVSLAVTFSIIRRRRCARLRDNAEEHASEQPGNGIVPRIRARRISSSTLSSSSTVLHTEASEDAPNPNLNIADANANMGARVGVVQMMEGPAPFVPRFFPGTTVLSTDRRNRSLPPPLSVVEGLSVDVEGQDGIPPPPYDFSAGTDFPTRTNPGTASPNITSLFDSQSLPPSTTQQPTRVGALHSMNSTTVRNEGHLPIAENDDIDEGARNYTYADVPPASTPPPIPPRPPSPPLPPTTPSSPDPRSHSPSHSQPHLYPNSPPRFGYSRTPEHPGTEPSAPPPPPSPSAPPSLLAPSSPRRPSPPPPCPPSPPPPLHSSSPPPRRTLSPSAGLVESRAPPGLN